MPPYSLLDNQKLKVRKLFPGGMGAPEEEATLPPSLMNFDARSPSFNPDEDEQLPESPSRGVPNLFQKKKSGILDTLKDTFLGHDYSKDPNQPDELGVSAPQGGKRNAFASILNLALPTLARGFRGEGAVNGLLEGLSGNRAQEDAEEKRIQEGYGKSRDAAQKLKMEELRQKQPSNAMKEFGEYNNMTPVDQQNWLKYNQSKQQVNPLGLMNYNLSAQKYQNDLQRQAQEDALKAKGTRLPADKATLLADFRKLPNLLSGLQSDFTSKKDVVGPIAGRLRGANPYDTSAQGLQAKIDAVRQVVGKALEGGVLRKEDEAKYAKIMPTLSDTPEVIAEKIPMLSEMLKQDFENNLSAFEDAGYDVSNFRNPKPLRKTGNAPSQGGGGKPTEPYTQQHEEKFKALEAKLKAEGKI